MSKIVVLIGLPGVGKSTFAADNYDSRLILSSDAIRKELFGSEEDMSDHDKVFKTLYSRMENLIMEDGLAVFDATNISRKKRKQVFDIAKKHGAKVNSVFFTESLEMILDQNSKRNRKVPEEVIRNKYKHVHVPIMTEGWFEVEYIVNRDYLSKSRINDMDGFDQKNPHHQFDLGTHSKMVESHLVKYYRDDFDCTVLAGRYHDIGKIDTQTFDDNGIAHYYMHENVSTQIFIQELANEMYPEDMLYASTLIQLHMEMYNHKDILSLAKYARKFDNGRLFYDLLLLHEADKLAH